MWRKSSYSADGHGNCVELAALPGAVGIRDSKNPKAGHLRVDRSTLAGLVEKIKSGGLDF